MSDMDATTDLVDVFADAVRVPVESLRSGDYVFTPTGQRIKLLVVALRPKSRTVRTTREDGWWDTWSYGETITIVRGER